MTDGEDLILEKVLQRDISRPAERELWARAAGRCQFDGCNRILYKSPVTQETVNISEKAHIYSFSKNGPRGHGPFKGKEHEINDISNLLLVCHDCHKKIDHDKIGSRYSGQQLREWKEQHERRVEIVTGISCDKKSHVVFYGAKIHEELSPLRSDDAHKAMFPNRYPSSERPVCLSMSCSHEDNSNDYWRTEEQHLRTMFDREIRPRIEESNPCNFSLFAFAPQPLLILLGALFTDKTPVDVFQLHREPPTWQWQKHPQEFTFNIIQPKNTEHNPALVISLSDKINHDRVYSVLDKEVCIWEITVNDPHNDFLKSEAQLSMFREYARKLMVMIKDKHGHNCPLHIFPAMPISCAVEIGRIRMPKADMPWIIYDQNNKVGGFVEALKIQGGK